MANSNTLTTPVAVQVASFRVECEGQYFDCDPRLSTNRRTNQNGPHHASSVV